jgi:hypothetical protein
VTLVKGTLNGLRIEELRREPGHLTCAYSNVVLFFSSASPNRKYLDASVDLLNAHAAKCGTKLALFIVISASERPPDEATRRALQAAYAGIKKHVRAGVLVVEGEGFLASAKRSIITLFSSSSPFPIRVASNIAEGARHIVKLMGNEIDPRAHADELAAAASLARAQL